MTFIANRGISDLGNTCVSDEHDVELVHELGHCLQLLWRYDRYVAKAGSRNSIRQFWSQVRDHELQNIQRLKDLLNEEN